MIKMEISLNDCNPTSPDCRLTYECSTVSWANHQHPLKLYHCAVINVPVDPALSHMMDMIDSYLVLTHLTLVTSSDNLNTSILSHTITTHKFITYLLPN